ncbi:MAG TPA: LuxR C-terminal-related transcriptional regulator [Acidimicrobiia bacterium]|nr:LuxR C-terminal-related transcriptional regulator [Acidimicrobiia bacterium]
MTVNSGECVEREVCEGHPNVDIARRLYLAEVNVPNYLSSAIVKLGARNRTEAFAKAQEMGYI